MTNLSFDDIIIQAYSENDFENYFQMQLENKIYEHFGKEMIRNVIKESLADSSQTENYSVFLTENMAYCGNIELQKYSDEYSLGIKISNIYQHRGIGTIAVKLFCKYCFEKRGINSLVIRIDPENKNSISLFEKLGAIYKCKQLTPEFEKLIMSSKNDYFKKEIEELGAYHYVLNLPLIE